MKRLWIVMIGIIVMCSLTAGEATADETRDRMIKRKPAIAKLVAKGVVAEGSSGYLTFVGDSREGEAVVKAENADRKKVYTRIAAETKTSAEAVGKRRAKQIAGKKGKSK